MISLETLQNLSKKYQTNFRNIVREYIQHQFLYFFYQTPQSEKFLFKGGTALRFIYQSPRFSEDLDFTGVQIHSSREIDDLFLETARQLENAGLSVALKDGGATSGGYLGALECRVYDTLERIRFEVSLREKRERKNGKTSTVVTEYSPPYTVWHLASEEIVKGKIHALLERQKPRDYYDFYFILRHQELHACIQKGDINKVKKLLQTSRINFTRELSVLLPKSHHGILRNFKDILNRETKRFL